MRQQESSAPAPLWQASIVCILAALFYLYEFSLQVSPGVMTTELMKAYAVGSTGVGTISAFYYYAYTPMQLPAGILYDRFGPRRLLPIAVLVCAFGALFFSTTHNILMASLGRFMMGFGSAFSFIGTLVLVSRWFSPKYFAILAGIAQLMSSIGAIFGEVPLAGAIHYFGWRHSMLALAAFGILLALLMVFIIRDYPKGKEPAGSKKRRSVQSLKGLSKVVRNGQTWYVATYAFLIWAPIAMFAALWGVPFIRQVYQTSTPVASTMIAMIWLGIGVGSPLMGFISEKINLRCVPLRLGASIGLITSVIIIYMPNVPFGLMYFLLFCMGLSASGQTLSFAVIKDVTEPKYVGTAVGFNNMAVVAGGAIFQPAVGYLINLFWDGTSVNGIPYYQLSAFQNALWVIPLCYIFALIMSWYFINETHCKRTFMPQTGSLS